MNEINYGLILIASLIAIVSPGPATIAIASTSMDRGRLQGAALAVGVSTGSLIWSLTAALGLSAVMAGHAGLFEALRYCGAAYLLYMAWNAARSAMSNNPIEMKATNTSSRLFSAYSRGLAIHLTNPKAVLFFGSLYSIGIPAQASIQEMMFVNALIVSQGFIVFQAYALIFSIPKVRTTYVKLRRWFEGFFALVFGAVGFSLLIAKFE